MVAVDRGYPGIGRGDGRARWSRSRWPRRLAIAGAALVGVVLVAAAVVWGVFDTYRIAADDMWPTLRAGDRVIARPTISADHGDVVVYRHPQTGEAVVGRVVAVGGDRIGARDGALLINDVVAVEPYLPDGTRTPPIDPWTIPDQHLYVLGDHRGAAVDSRRLGAIRGDRVVARVVARSWPPGRIGAL